MGGREGALCCCTSARDGDDDDADDDAAEEFQVFHNGCAARVLLGDARPSVVLFDAFLPALFEKLSASSLDGCEDTDLAERCFSIVWFLRTRSFSLSRTHCLVSVSD